MPRSDSKYVHSNHPYSDNPAPHPVPSSADISSSPTTAAPKKKHVCTVCDRCFSTSGHLARHSRVHTGERNHRCPFPGCETRCSRQDNLQQHYRIHLSPGSRRNSSRSAVSRAMNNKRLPSSLSPDQPALSPPPLSAPPALEHARVYQSSPPDSPPPLAPATLPSTAHPTPQPGPNPTFAYRSSPIYHPEHSAYPYVPSLPSSSTPSFPSYSGHNHHHFPPHSLPHINTTLSHPHPAQESPIPTPVSSRHSISHISHPQTYPHNPPSSAEPPSPASSHSHNSNPEPPSYVYHHDDSAHSFHTNPIVNDQTVPLSAHLPPHAHPHHPHHHNGYSAARFVSPHRQLAPLQVHDRYSRRDDRSADSFLHSGSLSADYAYHPSLLSNSPWKSESSIRKGVGALVQ